MEVMATVGRRNVTGYSVDENATPLDASSTEGGVGQISFAVPEDADDTLLLYDEEIQLDDDFRGTTSGVITALKLKDGIVTVTADGRLGALVGETRASPITGTFEAVARYYLELGALNDEAVYFEPSVAVIPVTAQGWFGDAWLHLKQLATANGVEISFVSNKVVFRPAHSFVTSIRHKTDFEESMEKGDAAQYVEVEYYDNQWKEGELVYPRTVEEIASETVYQVEAGAVLEDDIQLSVSLESVIQPVCVDDVAVAYDGTYSVYSVRGSDNSLVTPQQWKAAGGKIELSINDDTTSVHIKITASNNQYYGPYRIAGRIKEITDLTTVISGPGVDFDPNAKPEDSEADYASLRIVGTGTHIATKTLTLPTGLAAEGTATGVGVTAQNVFVSSLEDAYRVGVYLASRWIGEEHTVTGTLTQINQRAVSGSILYQSIGAFDTEYAGMTISQFNSQWSGKTIADFNALQRATVEDNFDNQVFGNVCGARFKYNNSMFRITSSTTTNADIQMSAVRDTMIEDFNAAHSGQTIADFNALYAGRTLKQFGRIPLLGG
jgi:hypothetical protein